MIVSLFRHPLHYARRLPPLRAAISAADVPVWAHVPAVPHKVRLQRIRHARYRLGLIEPETRTILAAQTGTLWDVGANFGYFTWLWRGPAVMVEPDPDNLALINATAKHRPDVHVVAAAASDTAGHATFARDTATGARGSLARDSGPTITVPTIRLDDLAADHRVDVLKIDVEGHQDAVLAGAADVLARDRPLIIVEAPTPPPIAGYRPVRQLDGMNWLMTAR